MREINPLLQMKILYRKSLKGGKYYKTYLGKKVLEIFDLSISTKEKQVVHSRELKS